ncbi:hypothetical protein BON30_32855 [Cystobacter ferrugineus]|uniref:Uncharacterized protein n=1 Tax=Cystobacter ferrugineus TaxID=83449 RepID=A0A1L9B2R7_9BACT|nr:hypothetical protein BON30_32855 [Cystobacter ferrugineus]
MPALTQPRMPSSELHATAVPVEQRHAQLLLEPADARGDVGLHRVQLLRRPADSPRAGHGLEDLEFGCIHVGTSWGARRGGLGESHRWER